MKLTVLQLLILGSVATGKPNTTFTGCNLRVPKDVRDHMEAKGEPLVITIIMIIKFVRDVPDSGGSFGVEIKYMSKPAKVSKQ